MEVKGGEDHKLMVCIYEFLGTALLAYAILVSGGNAQAVAFTVTCIIFVLAPITGAHMNPAVTIGVYTSRGNFGKEVVFMLLIILFQCLGGFLGIAMAVGSLYSDLGSSKIIPIWIPYLCPEGVNDTLDIPITPCDTNGDRHFQTFFTQFVCTFMFVLVILVFKGENTAPT